MRVIRCRTKGIYIRVLWKLFRCNNEIECILEQRRFNYELCSKNMKNNFELKWWWWNIVKIYEKFYEEEWYYSIFEKDIAR